MRNGSITWEWPTRLRKKCLRYVITDITDHCSRNALVWEDNMSTEGEENEGFWQSSTAEIATVNAHWKEHFSRNKAGDIFNDNIPARYSLQLPDICWIIMVFTLSESWPCYGSYQNVTLEITLLQQKVLLWGLVSTHWYLIKFHWYARSPA